MALWHQDSQEMTGTVKKRAQKQNLAYMGSDLCKRWQNSGERSCLQFQVDSFQMNERPKCARHNSKNPLDNDTRNILMILRLAKISQTEHKKSYPQRNKVNETSLK